MVTTVKILGSNRLIASIAKALFVSNVISTVSFLGMSGLIVWQVWRSSERVKELGEKINGKTKSQKSKDIKAEN